MKFLKSIKTAKYFHFLLLSLTCYLLHINSGIAQTTRINGVVVDAATGEPLISAAVNFQGTNIGTNTDFDGKYELVSENASDTLVVTYLGYEPFKGKIKIEETQTLDIKLESEAILLKELVVTVEKERYRNKDNPAVQLIKKVIAQKEKNRASSYDFYEYEKYEKIVLGLSNLSEKFKNRKVFKKFQFLFENLDTTSMKGKEMLPIYLKESLSDVRYRKNPETTKELIHADTMVTFEGYGDSDGFHQYLDYLYQNVNIYDDNIVMLKQQFLSPIADNAPLFYKFYIQDTLEVEGVECIEMFFAPKNNFDILFQGNLYIAYKDNYNIKKVDISINPNISLNWVKTVDLLQVFEKKEGHGYIQTIDEFTADFGLGKKGTGVYGHRAVSNKQIKINQARPATDYEGEQVERLRQTRTDNDAFWKANRHEELSVAETDTYQKIDSLKNEKVFQRTLDVAIVLLTGYTNISPYFELGPLNTFCSFNPIEGIRPRIGGRTTPKFSEKIEIEGYGAYGLRDKKWKGHMGINYALSDGNLHKFPVKKILMSARRDTKIPGQELQFVQEDNFLLSFRRGVNDKYLYNTYYRFEYLNEYKNNFTLSVGYWYWAQSPAGSLAFLKSNGMGDILQVNEIKTSEINGMLRWAPNEKFYQGKTYRTSIINGYPVFTLRYNFGVKDLLGGEYNYQKLSLGIYKRFFMSRLGQSDVYLDGGITLGQLPYPLLSIHNANQTYSFQLQGYNLMNFLEFVSDRYISLNIDHNFNGFFLNRIPLIRQLKLRETFNIRVLYGGIRDRNQPEQNTGLIYFPTDEAGNPTTYSLEKEPYLEASIGLANIFKFFRVDLVKRFNYLKNPNVDELGVRARFKIYF